MKSDAKSVESYIAAAPVERREALTKVRAIYRKVLKGAVEGMEYGMPCYKRGETLVGAFASQAQYLALYGFGKVIEEYKAELKGASLGKGCIRFKKMESIDFKLVERLLREKLAAK